MARRALRIREKYSDRVPVILDADTKIKFRTSGKLKFLIPRVNTVGSFMQQLRNEHITNLTPTTALYSICTVKKNGTVVREIMLLPSLSLGTVDQEYVSDDGYVYLALCVDNVFGASRSIRHM